jgi:hypothetical protein
MTTEVNRDSWNRHKWRRDTSWWDDLEVPTDELKERDENVFDWLESVAPDPYEHDYVLYTDGSGCVNGWGGYAALYERIELLEDLRGPASSGAIVAGTYGSTVQRSEFNAFLDGVHKILSDRCEELQDRAAVDEEFAYKIGTEGLLSQFSGPDRISIIWYTDRNNLAQCLLFDQKGEPLLPRTKERDLWMRWSFMAKHVCVTPMCRPRNVVAGQAACDTLAGAARALLMGAEPEFSNATQNFYSSDQWLTKKPQTARF